MTDLSQNEQEMIDSMFAHVGYDANELEAINEAQRDLLGSANTNVPLQRHDSETALQAFQAALQELPTERKQAYLTAMERNPQVVRLESPPGRFLLFNNYDHWKAAEQMVDYWTERRKIFGMEKYSLPLRLKPPSRKSAGSNTTSSSTVGSPASNEDESTGIQSCISEGGQISIQSGMRMILPPDKFGRFVYMIDREKIISAWEDPCFRTQALFYFIQVICEAEQAITKGFICVAAFESGESRNQHKPDGSTIRLVQSGIFPIQLRALHMIQMAPEKSMLAKETLKMFVSVVQNFSSVDFRRRTCFYDTEQQALDDLKEYGIRPWHLPKRFGGIVEHEFPHWLMHRLCTERERYAFLDERDETISRKKRPLPQNQEDRDLYIKRRREEFRWRNRERLEKMKIQIEHDRKEKLQQQTKALLARIEVAKTLAEQYESDVKVIHKHITSVVADFLPTMGNGPAGLLQDPNQSARMASIFLKDYLRFRGRHPQTGQWILLLPNDTTSFSQSTMMDLSWLRDDLLRLQPTLVNQHDRDEGKRAEDDSPQPRAEEVQITELQQKCRSLQKQVDEARGKNRFLEALMVCSKDTVEQHEEDKRQIKASMLKIFEKLPSLVPAVQMLVTHVLDNHTTYNGRFAVNDERTEWKPSYFSIQEMADLSSNSYRSWPGSQVSVIRPFHLTRCPFFTSQVILRMPQSTTRKGKRTKQKLSKEMNKNGAKLGRNASEI